MPTNVMPAYHFTVEWGGTKTSFAEVTGLDIEIEVSEYRDGADPSQSVRKIPGVTKYSNITLKRGITKGDNDFFAWLQTKNIDQVERRDLVINLLNAAHEPVITWKVHNAFPMKYCGPTLNAKSGEVAMESLEIAHEGLTIQTA